jgi:hypothetical protein
MPRPLSVEIRVKLAKLIRLLDSSREGEVLASVRAIRRTLASAGADLHDLADALTNAVPKQSPPADRPTTARRRAPDSQQQTKPPDASLKELWVNSCLMCLMHPTKLTKVEWAFVRKLKQRLADNEPYKDRELRRLMRICDRIEAGRRTAGR